MTEKVKAARKPRAPKKQTVEQIKSLAYYLTSSELVDLQIELAKIIGQRKEQALKEVEMLGGIQ